MKIIYSAILILGSIIARVGSLPIIYSPFNTNTNTDLNTNQNQQIDIDIGPAIVVTRPHKPILYNPENEPAIVPPPPPPPSPPGPIIFRPQDSKPFIISPFSDLEPVIE